ncbi:TonB-dependent receptor, plug [Parvularcula bermudensis HTCC2503]|uniref:TonB-dependent receptor, plug n=1 Tax=Parvularcula bermudensis (strain ATCC BAA-594 / HTCC2503 / KCTC 12087) TaxID=314260 RepID=E0TFY6_PARBH|nr:TonB-dependent receptor plug domain-containing protein [Parvularcula bermudensis]ADM10105.1 TonB-dependent receptor, plug [Parvularcula bermudensis HTCC2503]
MSATVSYAQADDLEGMSLEELLSAEVTSVAKKPQKINETAAAIFVIDEEDIRTSGADSIPELLRLVPGVFVSEVNDSITGVSARGYTWRYSSKMLILVDGREVYLPVISGVLWDAQLLPVEDIDRIEVIRGPGATLYGANALNGVINIVSKHAAGTLNTYATARAGVTTESGSEFGRLYARRGLRLGENATARVWTTWRRVSSQVSDEGETFHAPSDRLQIGFRGDWEPNDADAFTVQGSYVHNKFDTTFFNRFEQPITQEFVTIPDNKHNEYNILSRWTRTFEQGNSMTLQSYFTSIEREDNGSLLMSDILDIDFSHALTLSDRAEAMWGVKYRHTRDGIEAKDPDTFVRLTLPNENRDLFAGFVQGDVFALDRRLRVSAGTKLENNEFTGTEVQPSLRAIYSLDKASFWGAVSRAVRTPSAIETNGNIGITVGAGLLEPPNPLPIELLISGTTNEGVAEKLIAYELGWRQQFGNQLTLDMTAYYNAYDDIGGMYETGGGFVLLPFGPGGSPVPVPISAEYGFTYDEDDEGKGIEVHALWEPHRDLRLNFIGNVYERNLEFREGVFETPTYSFDRGRDPALQLSVKADYHFSDRTDASIWSRYVGQLEDDVVPAYQDLDIRLSHRLTPSLNLTLLGENLLEPSRAEGTPILYPTAAGEVERRVSISVAVKN